MERRGTFRPSIAASRAFACVHVRAPEFADYRELIAQSHFVTTTIISHAHTLAQDLL